MTDIRDNLFRSIADKRYCGVLTPERNGVLSGVEEAVAIAQSLGVEWSSTAQEGDRLYAGVPFAQIVGTPKQIALAEEQLIGALAKTSGIATAARQAVEAANGQIKIVSGAWKKMPPPLKAAVRRAVAAGGAHFRICEPPMLYLDKNYIWMFGSVAAVLAATADIQGMTKVIQIKGRLASVTEETGQAVAGGANVLMIDTGRLEDLEACLAELARLDCRRRVQIAFAGNVSLADIPTMAERGVDILGIGKEIVDAKLLDLRLDVIKEMSL